MNTKNYYIILIILFFSQFTFTQQKEINNNGFYIGLTPGIAYTELGYSKFIFKIGGTLYYNHDDYFTNLTYNQMFGLNFNFDENDLLDNSKFEKLEFTAGHSIQLHKSHPLFKHICLTLDAGISYNNLKFYKNESAHHNNVLTNLKSFGAPIGVGLTSDWNGLLFAGFEYKFQMLQKFKPYSEFSSYLAFYIF